VAAEHLGNRDRQAPYLIAPSTLSDRAVRPI
jgi:hypothetical protein